MAPKTCESDPNDIKIAIFSKKWKRIAHWPQDPMVCDAFQNSFLSPRLPLHFGKKFNFWLKSFPYIKILITCQPRPLATDPSFCGIFVTLKVPRFENF